MRGKRTTKVMLSSRLEPALIIRLKTTAASLNVSINAAISLALDALEAERESDETVSERLGALERNLLVLVESLEKKFTEASFNEKERLKSLLKLLGDKITEHDEAERARFGKFNPDILQAGEGRPS